MTRGNRGLIGPVFASVSLAFASIGDAFLYPFLPLNHATVGIPVIWVGVILSVNRFARIFLNAWMVHLFAKYGSRMLTIAASVLAIISTAGYAFATGVGEWLFLRIIWGLAFAALRISTLAYSLQSSGKGSAFGLAKGIQECGPVIALFIFPVLLIHLTPPDVFLLLTALSLPALYFAWRLPLEDDKTSEIRENTFSRIPSLVDAITFVSAFLIDGMIVVLIGILFLRSGEAASFLVATSMAAFYLGYRRICLVVFAPAGGWLADRIGFGRMFNMSLFMMIAGLAFLAGGWIGGGSIIVFTSYSMHVAIAPRYVSLQRNHPLASMAANATWRDLGAAAGTLSGGMLTGTEYLIFILSFVIFSLSLLFLWHNGIPRRAFDFLYIWK